MPRPINDKTDSDLERERWLTRRHPVQNVVVRKSDNPAIPAEPNDETRAGLAAARKALAQQRPLTEEPPPDPDGWQLDSNHRPIAGL